MADDGDAGTGSWAAVRADYDRGMTHRLLAETHGITLAALHWRMKRDLWPPRRRSSVVDRPTIITRMFRVLELQVADLEGEMAQMAQQARRSGEKEVVLLGKLAGNLERLMQLDQQAGEGRRTRQRSQRMEDIRLKLIERIEQLKRD